jgi:hypothetical protein
MKRDQGMLPITHRVICFDIARVKSNLFQRTRGKSKNDFHPRILIEPELKQL